MRHLACLLFLIGSAFSSDLGHAIAKAEGFYLRGSIPNRYHNPGDIKSGRVKYPGQIGVGKGGHVIFKDNTAGWAALESQINKMVTGGSRHYSRSMTLQDVAKIYAKDWRLWSKNVSRTLHCDQKTTLAELFPPPEAHMIFELDSLDPVRVQSFI